MQSIKHIINRNNVIEAFHPNKITERLVQLASKLDSNYDWTNDMTEITATVISKIKVDIMTTIEIANLTAATIYEYKFNNMLYPILASTVCIDNILKSGPKSFANSMAVLYFNDWKYCKVNDIPHPDCDELILNTPNIKKIVYQFVYNHKDKFLNQDITINNSLISYTGFKTLEKSYLMKVVDENGDMRIAETPQYLFMRFACSIICRKKIDEMDKYSEAIQLYDEMYNQGLYTFATPALMHAGGYELENYISCFLLTNKEDSIDGIYKTLHDMAMIAKNSGGIGVDITNIRSQGDLIHSTGGKASGLVKVLGVINSSSCYVNQGSDKRPGSISPYVEIWHSDILEIIEHMEPETKLQIPINKLFYGFVFNDYFLECCKNDMHWYLFSPLNAPLLVTTYGKEFKQNYINYVNQGIYKNTIKATDLMRLVALAKVSFSKPYIVNKCAINKMSMYKGYCEYKKKCINMSNLCTEIMEYSDQYETACCTLASINLAKMAISSSNFYERFNCGKISNLDQLDGTPLFNFALMRKAIFQCVRYLDDIIDINKYPTKEAEYSNKMHRPLGIGYRGLSDLFLILCVPFTSNVAKKLNESISRHMYYYALEASCELAKERGKFNSYWCSPYAKDEPILHCDLYETECNKKINWQELDDIDQLIGAPILDWFKLRNNIKMHGVRHISMIALMPTASTAKITNTSYSFEPPPYLTYRYKRSSGDSIEVNQYLIKELKKCGLLNKTIIDRMVTNKSIQKIEEIPAYLRKCFQTAYEYQQSELMKMVADRVPWVDQSQSYNQFLSEDKLNINIMYSILMKGHEYNLKTLSYYVNRPPPIETSAMNSSNSIKISDENECKSCSA